MDVNSVVHKNEKKKKKTKTVEIIEETAFL